MSTIVAKRRMRTLNQNNIKKLIDRTFSIIDQDQHNQDDFDSIINFRDIVTDKYSKVKQLDEDILAMITDDDELEADDEQATEFSLKYLKFITKVNKVLDKNNPKEDNQSDISSSSSSKKTVKLPPLKLDSFDGEPSQWQTFYENFNCAIDQNNDLSNIQKLTYLRNLVKGPALASISGLSLTNENYTTAINILKERYNNKQALISSHMKSLLTIDRVHTMSQVSLLRKIVDTIEVQVRSLENLGVKPEMYGPLLIPILLDKIPDELNLIISRKFSGEDNWDIKLVIDSLKSELKAREQTSIGTSSSYLSSELPFSADTLHIASSQRNYSPRNERYYPRHERNISSRNEQSNQPRHERNFQPRNDNYFNRNFPVRPDSEIQCIFCNKGHRSQHCKVVTNIESRKKILSDTNRCFRCLRLGHVARFCKSNIKCYVCNQSHHAALCHPKERTVARKTNDSKDDRFTGVTGAAASKEAQTVLLQTALAPVASNDSETATARLLFDNCSQLTYITPEMRHQLNLHTVATKEINIRTFGNHATTESLDQVELRVKSTYGNFISIKCFVKEICSPLHGQFIDYAHDNYRHLKGLNLADHNSSHSALGVDVLVGADYYWEFVEDTVVRGSAGPIALKSKVGYILSGKMSVKSGDKSDCNVMSTHVMRVDSTVVSEEELVKESLDSFWQADNVGDMDDFDRYRHTFRYDDTEKRYKVELPFKDSIPILCDNYNLCAKRFDSLEKKFTKDKDLLISYNDIFKDQLSKNIIEKVSSEAADIGTVHYLPHHPVIREDKTTTKLRIVFDASCSTYGPSLNDCLNTGPSLNTSLFGVLTRFRAHKIAFIADLEKAFLQILLDEKHRDYVRFIWYDDIESLELKELAVYRFCRVIFGVSSSPFLLSGSLIANAERYLSSNPTFVYKLLQSMHVDDLNSGADNITSANDFYQKSKICFSEAGFNLRKFQSNSVELELLVGEESCNKETVTKVLGLTWDKKQDILIFSFDDLLTIAKDTPTKRELLSFIAAIFDPLGLINPVVVKLKILFQDICQSKVNWDSAIASQYLKVWRAILVELRSFCSLSVPRWYLGLDVLGDVVFELHGFCDASQKAYGCCVYLTSSFNNNSQHASSLVASKSRVAPVTKNTVPRLELRGAVLLIDLIDNVITELRCIYKFSHIVCWTDSTIVLHWIRNCKKEQETFVQSRLEKIRASEYVDSWRYVDTGNNPADIVSRGCSLAELSRRSLWFKGPLFLFDKNVDVPFLDSSNCVVHHEENQVEVMHTAAVVNNSVNLDEFINVSSFSDYNRLLRVTCYVLRFNFNLRNKGERRLQSLSSEELAEGRKLWVMEAQKGFFHSKTYNQVKKDLGLHEVDGMLRCKGRIGNAPISFDARFPIFLPHDHSFTLLVIKHFHCVVFHNGVKETLNELRNKYWVPKARVLIKKLINRCYVCRRYDSKPFYYPIAPPLPVSRLTDDYAFKFTGVDYAGPVYVKNFYSDNSAALYKAWIFIFTCFTTRSLYLDIVPDCSSTTCIRAIRRFIARRGAPTEFLSDNGTQFTSTETQDFVATRGIIWKFNVPAAPWWGGLYERMVRSVKRCLKKQLRNARVSYDEIMTMLCEIEIITNNRPLTFIYENPGDQPITPNHLLFGRKLASHTERCDSDVNIKTTCDNKKRNNYLNSLLQHFWARWRDEYVKELREHHRSKKLGGSLMIKSNDVVLIHDSNVSRGLWKVGVVDELLRSNDGVIRSASVRHITKDGKKNLLKRPINHLYLLESNDNDEDFIDISFISDDDIQLVVSARGSVTREPQRVHAVV